MLQNKSHLGAHDAAYNYAMWRDKHFYGFIYYDQPVSDSLMI